MPSSVSTYGILFDPRVTRGKEEAEDVLFFFTSSIDDLSFLFKKAISLLPKIYISLRVKKELWRACILLEEV